MVVVDNNILSSLAKVDRLELLSALFDTIYTTPEVMHEFRDERVAGFPFAERIEEIHTHGKPSEGRWLAVAIPNDRERDRAEALLEEGIAPADSECLSLAEERGLTLITDDQHLGRVSRDVGVEVVDLETLILAAGYQGIFEDVAEGQSLLEALRERDFYVFSPGFEDRFLEQLGDA